MYAFLFKIKQEREKKDLFYYRGQIHWSYPQDIFNRRDLYLFFPDCYINVLIGESNFNEIITSEQ